MEINLIETFRSSLVMIVLLVASVVVFTFILERFWYLKSCSVNSTRFMSRIKNFLVSNTPDQALRLCEQKNKPLHNVIKAGLLNKGMSKENVEEMMNSARLEEKTKMERFLPFLNSMGGIAPLLGLYGTITGLIRAFRDLSLSGSAGPSVLAAGISEALYATVAGLTIAIPTVLFYNFFLGKIRIINTDLEVSSKKLLIWMFEKQESK
jgi:biopolymer transport protein ExbB